MLFIVGGCVTWNWLCVWGLTYSCLELSRSVKGSRFPEVYLHLSATLPPPVVVRSSSRAFLRKTIELTLPGLKQQSLPQVANLFGQGNQLWEGRASGFPTWGSHSQVLKKGKVTLLQIRPTQSSRVCKFPCRGSLQHQIWCREPSPLQEQAQLPQAPVTRLRVSYWRVMTVQLVAGG